jgi:hypothetical protein
MIKILILLNNDIVISSIEEVGSELGEPDCKLIKPFLITKNPIGGMVPNLEPWLSDYTKQDEYMIHSDKILTIVEPTARLLELYGDLTK